MAKLFPPNIEGTIPAFYGTTLVVPFTMNKAVSILEVKGFALKMKTVQSQLPIYFNNGKDSYKTVQKPVYFDSKTNIITFQLTPEEIAVLNVGQYYKIQLAYIGLDDTVGYYSTVGVVKYTTKPDVYISGLEDMGVNSHLYKYRGVYSQKNKDVTEKAYSYCFNLYDGAGHLIQTSGEQIHNSINDIEIYETCDDYEIKQDLDINKTYYVEYIVTTSNKMQISSGRYRIMQKMSIDPEIRVDLVPELNYENGYITLHLIGHKNELGVEYAATGTFRILRSSDKEGYGVWHEILKFSLYGQQPSRWLWQDMTIE